MYNLTLGRRSAGGPAAPARRMNARMSVEFISNQLSAAGMHELAGQVVVQVASGNGDMAIEVLRNTLSALELEYMRLKDQWAALKSGYGAGIYDAGAHDELSYQIGVNTTAQDALINAIQDLESSLFGQF